MTEENFKKNKMIFSALRIFFLVTFVEISYGSFNARFEFEDVVGGPGTSRSPWRSNASRDSSLRMFQGDRVHVDLCVPESLELKPETMIYSNDGLSDRIGVNIDGMYEFGSVDTSETFGGWGKHWDEFMMYNFSQPSVTLKTGQYSLVFQVSSSDCYGTELDAVDLTTSTPLNSSAFFCGSKLIRSENPSSCAQDIDSAMPPSMSTKVMSTQSTSTIMPTSASSSPKSTTQEMTTSTKSSQTLNVMSMSSKPALQRQNTTSAPETTETIYMSTKAETKSATITTQSMSSSSEATKLGTTQTGQTSTPSNVTPSSMKTTPPSSKMPTSTAAAAATKPTPTDTNTTTTNESTMSSVLSTITSTSTMASTKPSTPESSHLKSNEFVKQLSYPSSCITNSNVRVRFQPTTLNRVQIIARNNPKRQSIFKRKTSTDDDPKLCKNRIWQIGQINNDFSELGPLRYTNIDHDINAAKGSQMPFPGRLNPQFTRSVTIRYVVPKNVHIGKGFVYLSIGLVDVTSDVTVGMQYHIRRKRNPSKVEYVTITPANNVVGWDLPARAVSPSLENIITLYFNNSATAPLKIDFIRMESLGMRPKLTKENIVKSKQWLVRAFFYKPLKRRPTPEGMKVTIDGGKKYNQTDRVIIFRRPFRKVLTIYKNGKIFPFNKVKRSDDDAEGSKFADISGFVLGNPALELSSVNFDPIKAIVTLTYTDGSTVTFAVSYTRFRTRLVIIESTISNPSVEFLSTYVTNYITAVNKVLIDNKNETDVKDTSIEDTNNKRYTFVKTTPNKLYKVNDEYGFFFPNNVRPN